MSGVAALLLFSEISTPFLNAVWYLRTLNRHNTATYIALCAFVVFLFIFIRCTAVGACLALQLLSVVQYGDKLTPIEKYGYTVLPLLLLCLNFFWSYALLQKLMRAYRSYMKSKETLLDGINNSEEMYKVDKILDVIVSSENSSAFCDENAL